MSIFNLFKRKKPKSIELTFQEAARREAFLIRECGKPNRMDYIESGGRIKKEYWDKLRIWEMKYNSDGTLKH